MIAGSDFVNVETTSWVPPFSNDLNVHSFEGEHLQSLSTLGFTTAGLGNYVTTAASERGHSSAYVQREVSTSVCGDFTRSKFIARVQYS